jgi:hypothetical protein
MHAIKACGWGHTQVSSFLTFALHGNKWSASPPSHITFRATTEQGTGWTPELVWALWRREKCCAAAKNRITIPRSPGPQPNHYTDWATLTLNVLYVQLQAFGTSQMRGNNLLVSLGCLVPCFVLFSCWCLHLHLFNLGVRNTWGKCM